MLNKLLTYILIVPLMIILGCSTQKQGSYQAVNTSKNKGQLSEKQVTKFNLLYHNAVKEKILGNYELAENYYAQCLDIDPGSAASMYELATIYEMQGKDAESLELVRNAVNIDPQNEWYRMLLAGMYQKNGRFNESAKIFEDLVKDYPYRIEFYYEWANSLLYINKFREAITVYDQLEEKIGTSEEVSMQKEKLYLKLGETEKAIAEIKKLIRKNPAEAKYYGMLAELYQIKGADEQVLETYKQLLEIDANNPFVHLSLADYYRSKGDNARSFSELKLAFANPELNIDSKVHILLSYYMSQPNFDETKADAYELNEILVEAHPYEARAYAVYADFLYTGKEVGRARELYRKAIQLDDSKFTIWNQLLSIESELNDFKAMEEESSQAIELFPSQPSFYLFNGVSNIQNKKYDAAIESLNTGISLVVENRLLLSQFYANLGDAHYRNKNFAESDTAYEKVLEIDPNNTYVLNNYSYYLSLRGENLEKAEKMSKKSNMLEPRSPSFQDTYAWILYKLGRYEEAKEWLEKAIQYGGDKNSVILEHYGDVLYRLGNHESALEYWLKARDAGEGSEFLNKKIDDKKLYE